jgi:hypothetical protein
MLGVGCCFKACLPQEGLRVKFKIKYKLKLKLKYRFLIRYSASSIKPTSTSHTATAN